MPSITPPTHAGYTFGGYFTEPNGGGIQYYKADGTSARNWNKTAATTLYARWTPTGWTPGGVCPVGSVCVPGAGGFDGDDRSDFVLFAGGTWIVEVSALGRCSASFGSGDCIPVPADYDGDGKADFAVFDTATSTF